MVTLRLPAPTTGKGFHLTPFGWGVVVLVIMAVVGITATVLMFSAGGNGSVSASQQIEGPTSSNVQVNEIDLLTQDIVAQPNNPEVYRARADKLFAQGLAENDKAKVELAVRDLTFVIDNGAGNVFNYMDRGVAYTYLGETEKANADFETAKLLGAENGQIREKLNGLERLQRQY